MYIVVKLIVEGTHFWPECDIKEVEYLKYEHRHLFYIKCKKEVKHANRDIEIIMLKREIEETLYKKFGKPCNFLNMSCEDIAQYLFDKFELSKCTVLEDNENGAEIS